MKTIRVEICPDLNELDGPLLDVLEWAKAVVESVPEEFRPSARVECSTSDDVGTLATVFYCRPETDAEREANDDLKRRFEYMERSRLAELLAKYGLPETAEQRHGRESAMKADKGE